jgi:hypothetical protein
MNIVVVVALAAITTTLLATYLIARPDHSAATPAHSPYVELTSGTYQGAGWQLYAWQQEGHLCMEFDPSGSNPDHKPTAGQSAGAAACEFDRRNPSSGYYASGPGVAGSNVSFGPLPTSVVQIRVATHEVLPSAPLPGGQGLPAGRYWIHIMPPGWPTSADGTALDTPQPMDANSGSVPFQNF